jgi:long-subunit fatty acid transport protein
MLVGGVVAICTTPAVAGGLDRTLEPMGILFVHGNFVELSYGYADPKVSGVGAHLTPGKESGNMTKKVSLPGLAIKMQVSHAVDVALIYDEPFGAGFSYATGTGYYAQGWNGSLSTKALTGLLKYEIDSGISVYGGPRYETLTGNTSLPSILHYNLTLDNSTAFGYVMGAAYERPASGTLVSLTYNSRIDFSPTATETGGRYPGTSTAPIDMPQSVRLDVRQAISRTSAVMFMARWADWPQATFAPLDYQKTLGASAAPLIHYPKAIWDYSVGIGHKFNSTWSGAVMAGYEPSNGFYTGNLGPVDGHRNIEAVVVYTVGKAKITGGLKYIWLGDAQPGSNRKPPASANFTGNHSLAVGLKIGFPF